MSRNGGRHVGNPYADRRHPDEQLALVCHLRHGEKIENNSEAMG